jgi:hypothetical protein
VSVHVCVDLHDIKNCLMDIRGQLDLGLKRVDMAFDLLEQKECWGCVEKAGEIGLGERSSRAMQNMDCEVVGWSKPKKKNFKRKNKVQLGLFGPKPNKMLVQVSQ